MKTRDTFLNAQIDLVTCAAPSGGRMAFGLLGTRAERRQNALACTGRRPPHGSDFGASFHTDPQQTKSVDRINT